MSLKRQTSSNLDASDVNMSPVSSQPDSPNHKRVRVVRNASRQSLSRQRSSQEINPLPKLPTTPGTVFVFGSGDTGQLGLTDDMLTRKKPMPLRALDDEKIVDVVSGGLHTIAITEQGKLWSWGCNDQRALGRSGEEYEPGRVENLDDVTIVKVACGDSVTMALSDTGALYCWGTYRSAEGALGFSLDVAVQELPELFEPLRNETICDIAAGADHCLALTTAGRVYGWGNGQQFQLGRRVIERRKKNGLRPETLALREIKAIGSGSYHSFAISHSGELYVWGLNNYQQCGLMTDLDDRVADAVTAPTVNPGLEGKHIKAVAGGEHHTVVLLQSGEVYAFGRADSGQLGIPTNVVEQQHSHDKDEDPSKSAHKRAVGIPTKIPGLHDIEQISCGGNHSIAVGKDGTAYTWGFGEMFALGNGSDEDELTPCVLTGQKLENHAVHRCSAGGMHSVIVASPK